MKSSDLKSTKSKKTAQTELHPEPDSPKTRRRKPKKVRDQTSLLAMGTGVDSSSDSCMCEEEDDSGSGPGKVSRRKKAKKVQKSPAAKLVQEYLHAESSSDVEIEGLEPLGRTTRSSSRKAKDNGQPVVRLNRISKDVEESLQSNK